MSRKDGYLRVLEELKMRDEHYTKSESYKTNGGNKAIVVKGT
jgi:hypothetical protein